MKVKNKFDYMWKVLHADMPAENKTVLIELILCSDEEWMSYPGVPRLCRSRTMKYQKNFKGVGAYVGQYVETVKRGRKNFYRLKVDAIDALDEMEIVLKNTPWQPSEDPATEADSPCMEADTPAGADDGPSPGGANSTSNNTEDSKEDSSSVSASASTLHESPHVSSLAPSLRSSSMPVVQALTSSRSTAGGFPAIEGVSTKASNDLAVPDEAERVDRAQFLRDLNRAVQAAIRRDDLFKSDVEAVVREATRMHDEGWGGSVWDLISAAKVEAGVEEW